MKSLSAAIQSEIQITAQMDEQINEIRKANEEDLGQIAAEIETRLKQAQAWAEANQLPLNVPGVGSTSADRPTQKFCRTAFAIRAATWCEMNSHIPQTTTAERSH